VVAAAQVPQLEDVCGLPVPAGGYVGLRPENLTLTAVGQGQFSGKVELVEALGAETLVYVSTDGGAQLVARQSMRTNLQAGHAVGVSVDAGAAHLFDAQGRVTRSGAPAGVAGAA
jgi:multiple sugar transport system ATP-binding protein